MVKHPFVLNETLIYCHTCDNLIQTMECPYSLSTCWLQFVLVPLLSSLDQSGIYLVIPRDNRTYI